MLEDSPHARFSKQSVKVGRQVPHFLPCTQLQALSDILRFLYTFAEIVVDQA
jgi:hypothetical protein